MIRDARIAKEISGLMIEFSGRLDGSIATVRDQCSSEEFAAYRRAVGRIMGEMLLGVLNPLYAEHPSRVVDSRKAHQQPYFVILMT